MIDCAQKLLEHSLYLLRTAHETSEGDIAVASCQHSKAMLTLAPVCKLSLQYSTENLEEIEQRCGIFSGKNPTNVFKTRPTNSMSMEMCHKGYIAFLRSSEGSGIYIWSSPLLTTDV